MENTNDISYVRLCKRCKRNVTKGSICQPCKTYINNKYGPDIDWETAMEIERMQKRIMRYMEDEKY